MQPKETKKTIDKFFKDDYTSYKNWGEVRMFKLFNNNNNNNLTHINYGFLFVVNKVSLN